MIRTGPKPSGRVINPLRGEFAVTVDGALHAFDTRLSSIAAIEAACGDRAIVEVLNGIVAGRRARDVIPLLAAALRTLDPPPPAPDAMAERATVGEAEAFVLALIFALGFKVGHNQEGETPPPLPAATNGGAGANSRSAA